MAICYGLSEDNQPMLLSRICPKTGLRQDNGPVRFKEYSPEVRAELPQTKVADRQPRTRAGRPEGLVDLSATEVWGNQP